jgi:GntR family transcriptional regulator/MocR family aminotransferase
MFLPLQLDRSDASPLQDQLFEQLQEMIISGRLKPNTRIIGTRFLAEQVGVSRTTVLLAFERLISEGYLDTRPGVGTFVSSSIADVQFVGEGSKSNGQFERQAFLRPMVFNARLNSHSKETGSRFDFGSTSSDGTELLPAKILLRKIRDALDKHPHGLAVPQPPGGLDELRRAIADHLATTRGLMTSPEQVIVVLGRRQAFSIVAHLFQRRGDRVILECPTDDDTVAFFETRDAVLVPVPVDENGLETDRLPEEPASLAHVTPARQNPLGGILPVARREKLISWARQAGAYIIEDDCDAVFHYRGAAPPPIAALDPYGLVFYAGSFAKTLGTGIGLGYLVVPSEFVEPALALKTMSQDGCSWLEQILVAELMSSGEYNHHLRRLRKTYLERRDCLIEALTQHFGTVSLLGTEAGTQLTWRLPERFPPAHAVRAMAGERGINLQGSSGRSSTANSACRFRDRALILGYAAMSSARIRQGIERLSGLLRSYNSIR